MRTPLGKTMASLAWARGKHGTVIMLEAFIPAPSLGI